MRQVSLTALQGLLKEQVDQVFLPILKIEHADLVSPLLLVADKQPLVRADGTYNPFGFTIALPDDDEERITSVNLIVPIVEQSMVQMLRGTNDPFTCTLSIVRASDPDTVEIGPFVFESLGIDFEQNVATIALAVNRNIFEDAYPKGIFSPSNRANL